MTPRIATPAAGPGLWSSRRAVGSESLASAASTGRGAILRDREREMPPGVIWTRLEEACCCG